MRTLGRTGFPERSASKSPGGEARAPASCGAGALLLSVGRQTQPNLIAVIAIPAMKMVSSTIRMAGRQPADAMSLIRVLIPSAAIAATRQKRENRLPPSRTQSGTGRTLLAITRSAKAVANQGRIG